MACQELTCSITISIFIPFVDKFDSINNFYTATLNKNSKTSKALCLTANVLQ